MTASLPESVTIGCRKFVVRYAEDMSEQGRCDYDRQVLFINEKLRNQPVEAVDTFIHEVLHALDYYAKLDLGEDRVFRIAFQLTVFLIENGLLTSSLLAREAEVVYK